MPKVVNLVLLKRVGDMVLYKDVGTRTEIRYWVTSACYVDIIKHMSPESYSTAIPMRGWCNLKNALRWISIAQQTERRLIYGKDCPPI